MLLIILLTISAVSCLPVREQICHPDDEYTCKNGSCISFEWICDNVPDCLTGEDEADCHYLHQCASNEFMCRSGECLPKNVKCDGHFDCTDSSDEHGCMKTNTSRLPLLEPVCHPDDEFACKNGSCISTEWVCDNVPDCMDGEDEAGCHYLHQCASNEFMCRSGECLPKNVKCNGHFDCIDRSDEHGCMNTSSLPLREPVCHLDDEFACKNGSCISTEWVCDNVPDCLTGEDEANCPYLHECASNEFMCRSGECLPKSVKCDGHFDCTDRSDEHGCVKVLASFNLSTTTDASVIDGESSAFWVYILYMVLTLIVIGLTCISLYYYCIFTPRRPDESSIKFVAMEEDVRSTV